MELLQQQPTDVYAKIVCLLERCTSAAMGVTKENLDMPGLRLFFQQEPSWPNLTQYIDSCTCGLLLVPPCNVAARFSPHDAARHRGFAILFKKQ